jgi:hypothetical protein
VALEVDDTLPAVESVLRLFRGALDLVVCVEVAFDSASGLSRIGESGSRAPVARLVWRDCLDAALIDETDPPSPSGIDSPSGTDPQLSRFSDSSFDFRFPFRDAGRDFLVEACESTSSSLSSLSSLERRVRADLRVADALDATGAGLLPKRAELRVAVDATEVASSSSSSSASVLAHFGGRPLGFVGGLTSVVIRESCDRV